MYASVCDFVHIALLVPFVLGFCLSGFFLAFFCIVFSTCYNWWICFLVWLLSSFFLFFYYFKNIFLIIIFYFNNYFILFYLLLSFFSPFYSEPCGCQAFGAPARRQGCAPKVGEPSSGHWPTRDLPAPCNIKRRKSPRDLHLNAKTHLHSMTSKLQCWTPYAKQLARQEHNPPHEQRGCLKS